MVQLPSVILDMPEKKVLQDLSGGVDYSMPASKIAENTFSDALNLQFFLGLLRPDTGYTQYRQATNGTPQAVYQFTNASNGTTQTLLLTTFTFYVDNGLEWQYVSDGLVNQPLTAQTNAGSNTFTVAQLTSLKVGDPVGITLASGFQLRTTVQTLVLPGTVTTATPVPQNDSAAIGAALVRPPQLNGNTGFQPCAVPWPTLNSLIFTNGVDPIQIWDGTNCKVLAGWNNITSRVLANFHGFLILFDTTEQGGRFPQRARWSDQNNPNVSSGVGTLAGFVDLTDTSDTIVGAQLLGPWLIIYRTNSVMRRSYIGDPIQLFFDEYMLENTGAFCQNAIANCGSTHVFAGPSGIFRYTGGYDSEDVGTQIFDRLYGPEGIANSKASFLTTLIFVPGLDEVWLGVPTGTNTSNLDTWYRLDQGRGAWFPRKFANAFVGYGFIQTTSGRTWQTSTLPWNQDTSSWLANFKSVQAAPILFCDPINMVTWIYDFLSSQDGANPIVWSATTKDFETLQAKVRLDGFYAKGTGSAILVELSMDRGTTWNPYGTLNFGLTFTTQQVNEQFVGDAIRFRLSGSDPQSSLDWIRVDYFPESEW